MTYLKPRFAPSRLLATMSLCCSLALSLGFSSEAAAQNASVQAGGVSDAKDNIAAPYVPTPWPIFLAVRQAVVSGSGMRPLSR